MCMYDLSPYEGPKPVRAYKDMVEVSFFSRPLAWLKGHKYASYVGRSYKPDKWYVAEPPPCNACVGMSYEYDRGFHAYAIPPWFGSIEVELDGDILTGADSGLPGYVASKMRVIGKVKDE